MLIGTEWAYFGTLGYYRSAKRGERPGIKNLVFRNRVAERYLRWQMKRLQLSILISYSALSGGGARHYPFGFAGTRLPFRQVSVEVIVHSVCPGSGKVVERGVSPRGIRFKDLTCELASR